MVEIYWRDLSESGQDKYINKLSLQKKIVPEEILKNLQPVYIIKI